MKKLILSLLLIMILAIPLNACSSQSNNGNKPLGEEEYSTSVLAVMESFYNNRKNYNDSITNLGEKARQATSGEEYNKVMQEVVNLLDDTCKSMSKDRDNLTNLYPPKKFQEFHILLNSAIADFIGALQLASSLYSIRLNQGTVDPDQSAIASAKLKTANENMSRAGFMYNELVATMQ